MELIVGHTYPAQLLPVGTVYYHPIMGDLIYWVSREKDAEGNHKSSRVTKETLFISTEAKPMATTGKNVLCVIAELPGSNQLTNTANDPSYQGRWKNI